MIWGASEKKNKSADVIWRGFDAICVCDVHIELLDIECALCHVTGVQFDKIICPYKSAILDFLQKNRLLLHKMSLGELILPL